MISKEMKTVIESIMTAKSKRELVQLLFARFVLLLLSDIELKDYEKIQSSIYDLKKYLGLEE